MTPSSTRRERERAERHQLIIDAARDLAEAEGWDAVTTRRLAAIVEYSQPVLYSHFDGKDAIVRAVALQGFADLADSLRRARLEHAPAGPAAAARPQQRTAQRTVLRAVCLAYLDFAVARPALYQAMFVMPTDVKFASEQTPPELLAGFDEFVAVLPPGAPQRELTAEVLWSALHGFATLAATGRIPPGGQDQRVDVLLSGIADDGDTGR
jgi:AcrR family transcriptional regulator